MKGVEKTLQLVKNKYGSMLCGAFKKYMSLNRHSPKIRKKMQNTISQNMDLMSPLPQRMPTASAKGLRRDMRPKLPNEMLMTRKNESLRRDFEINPVEPVVVASGLSG